MNLIPVGVRAARHAPLEIVEASIDQIAPELLVPDQPVLLDRQGSISLAFIAIGAGQILRSAGGASGARISAVGYGSPAIIDLIGQRNAAALRTAQSLASSGVVIRDAAWHLDQARLRIVCDQEPGDVRETLRERLAEAFKTEIRFAWPGGEEPPRLG